MNEKLIEQGFYATGPATIASVSTYLEMRAAPPLAAFANDPAIRPARLDAASYRKLFLAVGADYLWVDHARRGDDELRAILTDDAIETWTVEADGAVAGFAMLDFREAEICELRYFGLVRAAIGCGLGHRLLHVAIARAFARPIRRFWVRTSTLDHPAALPLYVRAGFTPYKRHVSVSPDPRLTGLLPRDAAPQIAIL
ncbi:MAG TPA: GNAT family N-acetyltransferase [Rhodoblastus sp.]|nr:GNAT family N-acetyltransferase [Rhodoblastus sp.]